MRPRSKHSCEAEQTQLWRETHEKQRSIVSVPGVWT
jgi:hypothetical protein